MRLPEHIESAIEKEGWEYRYVHDRVELVKYTYHSVDYMVTVGVDCFEHELRDHCVNFDADEYATDWIKTSSESGEPESIIYVTQNALEIREMLDKLLDAVVEAEGKQKENDMELENALAVARAYYESCGFDLLCRDYECVDGGVSLVFGYDDVLRFVDVYDHHEETDEETENRVRSVFKNYLLRYPEAKPTEVGYDVVTAIMHPNGITFDVDVDVVSLHTQEDKAGFVEDFQNALIEHGAGRYDHLRENPIEYEEIGGTEWLRHDGYPGTRNVTGESLTSIAKSMISLAE